MVVWSVQPEHRAFSSLSLLFDWVKFACSIANRSGKMLNSNNGKERAIKMERKTKISTSFHSLLPPHSDFILWCPWSAYNEQPKRISRSRFRFYAWSYYIVFEEWRERKICSLEIFQLSQFLVRAENSYFSYSCTK